MNDSRHESGEERILTEAALKKLLSSSEHNYYFDRSLIPELYLDHGGWTQIERLDEFSGLRALYSSHNNLSNAEAILSCRTLVTLELGHNLIREIVDLKDLSNLRNVNLSHNLLTRVSGFPDGVTSLNVSHNRIEEIVSSEFPCSLEILDISENGIGGQDLSMFLGPLSKLKALKVLYAYGNQITSASGYRRRCIEKLESLTFLDQLHVKDSDRMSPRSQLRHREEVENHYKSNRLDMDSIKSSVMKRRHEVRSMGDCDPNKTLAPFEVTFETVISSTGSTVESIGSLHSETSTVGSRDADSDSD